MFCVFFFPRSCFYFIIHLISLSQIMYYRPYFFYIPFLYTILRQTRYKVMRRLLWSAATALVTLHQSGSDVPQQQE